VKSKLRLVGVVLLLAAVVLYVLGYGAWAGFLVFGAIAEITTWILILTNKSREDIQQLKHSDT